MRTLKGRWRNDVMLVMLFCVNACRYKHFVAGVEHANSFSLLVYRMCEILQWCIPPENFYITLHYDGKESSVEQTARIFFRCEFIDIIFLRFKKSI
jgi:hypothetical protein